MKSFPEWIRACVTLAMCLVWTTAPGWGQEAPADEQVRAEIRFFCWETSKPTSLWIKQQKAAATNKKGAAAKKKGAPQEPAHEEVKCEPQAYSKQVNYQGSRKVQIFRKGDPAMKEAAFVQVATAELPAGGGRCILLVEEEGGARRVHVYPYDEGALTKGQMMLLNATDGELEVRIGEEKKALVSHAFAVFPVASFTDYQMPIEVFEKQQEALQMKISARLAIRFDDKNLGILYPRANDQQVAFALLPELVWQNAKPKK